jgi:hypothetical protein
MGLIFGLLAGLGAYGARSEYGGENWLYVQPVATGIAVALIGILLGWFIGITMPQDDPPNSGPHWGQDRTLCQQCHRRNQKGDRYCANCGSPLLS